MDQKQIEECCCFTGHRFLKASETAAIKEAVYREAEMLYLQRGVKYFGNGGAIGFDALAAEAVLALREQYPEIKLIMVLPCRDQDRYWREADRRRFSEILKQADKIHVMCETYHDRCMLERNRHLVNHSAYCIAYLRRRSGGTQFTVAYARKKGLEIIYI